MCLRLKSVSSLVTAIRKVCDSSRYLVVKNWEQALKPFRKCFLFCLRGKETEGPFQLLDLEAYSFFFQLMWRLYEVP